FGQRGSTGWPKSMRTKPRVVAAVDAESDIDVESSVPVVKSRTVSDSLRECGASHVSSSQKIPCRPQAWVLLGEDPTAFKELHQNRLPPLRLRSVGPPVVAAMRRRREGRG